MQSNRTPALARFFGVALILLVGVFAASLSAAAPSVYKVEETELGLQELVGSSTLKTGTTSTSGFTDMDYNVNSSLFSFTLPYTFYFFETTHSTSERIWASHNGYIFFSESSSTSTFSGWRFNCCSTQNYYQKPEDLISGSNVPYRTAMVAWDDLLMRNNPAPRMSYKHEGLAGNMRTTIEWKSVAKKTGGTYTSASGTADGEMTFQIVLHQATNIIEFKYQTDADGMDWSSSMEATIGLRPNDAQADHSVVVQTAVSTAPLSNYRFSPQFYCEWDGDAGTSDVNSSGNWTRWDGNEFTAAMTTSSSMTSSASNYLAYIPDLTNVGSKPVITAGSYYCSGLLIDQGGEFTISGGSLELYRKGTGKFENNGTFSISGSGKLTVSGEFLNIGTFNATGGNTTIVMNGPGDFGDQLMTFGGDTIGPLEIEENGATDPDLFTTVGFVDFVAGSFSSLETEAKTLVLFIGDTNLAGLGNVDIDGGLAFEAIGSPVNVQVPPAFEFGTLKLRSPSAAAGVIMDGDVVAQSIEMIGDGSFTFTGDIDSDGQIGVNGTGAFIVGTNPASNGDVLFAGETFFLANASEINIKGDVKVKNNDTIDVNLKSPNAIQIGGDIIVPDGSVTLESPVSVTVNGVVDGHRGVSFKDTPSVTVGPGMGAMDTAALKTVLGTITFSNVDDLLVQGDIVTDSTVILLAGNSLTVDGDIRVGIVSLQGTANFNFKGDFEVQILDSQSDADVIIGGDFIVTGNVNDMAPGVFSVGGQVVLKDGPNAYSVSFQNRPLVSGSIKVEADAEVSLAGNIELSFTGLGNIALDVEPNGQLTFEPQLDLKLVGAGEGVVRNQGTMRSIVGAGVLRPKITGGSIATQRARMVFAPGSITNVDGLELANFGSAFATHALFMDSGAVVSNLDNLSVTGSAAAKAVIRIGTGSLPPTLNALEISGTSPASIDAESVQGFTLSFTKGPNNGGNLYGAGSELDPQNIMIWENDTPLAITTGTQLPNAQQDTPYNVQIQSVGGNLPFTWELDQFSAPAWLSIDAATGRIFGTPPAVGATGPLQSFNITARDSTPSAAPAVKNFRLTLDPKAGDPLQIETSNLPVGFEGVPYTTSLLAVGGSQAGYNYTLVSGTLPAGVITAADFSTTGTITTLNPPNGNMVEFGAVGDYNLGFVVTDSNGASSPVKFLTLTIAPGTPAPIFTTTFLPDAVATQLYTFQFTAANGTAPYTYRVVAMDGSPIDETTVLPAGFTLTSSGILRGTTDSSQVRSFSFFVRVTDAFNTPSTQAIMFDLEVRPLDLGPISIDGPNTHGTGGSCATTQNSNWWIALVALLPLALLLRRREEA